MKITIANAIQLQAAAVACNRHRRFWANLVPDLRFSSLAWVSGLLALLVVAVSPASAQDPLELTLLPATLQVDEDAGEISYIVGLTSQPSSPVSLTVSIDGFVNSNIYFPGESEDERIQMLTLPIDSSNYEGGVMVTVKVKDNSYWGENRGETIIHSASGDGYTTVMQDLQVTIDDDEDIPRVTLALFDESGNPLAAVAEGSEVILTLRASLNPLVGAPTQLAFLPPSFRDFDNFELIPGEEMTQTIPGASPDDTAPDTVEWRFGILMSKGIDAIAIDLVASFDDFKDREGDGKGVVTAWRMTDGMKFEVESVELRIEDSSGAEIILPRSQTVDEGSGRSTYEVSLRPELADPVNMTLTIEDSDNSNIYFLGSHPVGNPNSYTTVTRSLTLNLVFIPGGALAYLVHFGVEDNDSLLENPIEMITHEVFSTGPFNDAEPKTLQVVVVNDDKEAVRVSMTMTVSEDEESDNDFPVGLKVKLLDSNGEVVAREGTTELTLEFSQGEEMNSAVLAEDYRLDFLDHDIAVSDGIVTAQIPSSGTLSLRLNLSLIRDLIDEDTETFTIVGSVAGLSDGSVTFRIIDHPDDIRGIKVSRTTLELTEGEVAEEEYSVVLTSKPTDKVTVTLNIMDAEGVIVSISIDGQSLSSSELTFTPGNWNVPQRVTVTVDGNDHIQQRSTTVTIEHLASGGDYDRFTAPVVVAVSPALPLELTGTSGYTVIENQEIRYRVGLASEPSGPVSLIVSVENFTDDSNIYLLGGEQSHTLTLPIDSSNYESGVRVAFKVKDNDFFGVNRREFLIHSAEGEGYETVTKRIPVAILDDEPKPTITLSLDANRVREGHQGLMVSATLVGEVARNKDTVMTLVLPDERFTLADDDGLERTIPAGTKTVVSSWLVDVGTNDIIGDSKNVTFTVTTRAGLGVVPAPLEVVDDSPAEIVVTSSLAVSEGSRFFSYRVSLTSQPSGPVSVMVSIDDFDNSNIYLLSSGQSHTLIYSEQSHTLMLSFDSSTSSWNDGVEVQFAVKDNDFFGENRQETIIHVALGGGYNDEKSSSVTIGDDEASPAIILSLDRDGVEEGYRGRLVVTARLEPARNEDTVVTLVLPDEGFTLASGDSEIQTIRALTGTEARWTVDVDVDTNNIIGDSRIVTFTATTEVGLPVSTAVLRVEDYTAEIVVSSLVTVSEDFSNSTSLEYSVRLTSQPAGMVTVTASIQDFDASNIYFVDHNNKPIDTLILRFDSNNWEGLGARLKVFNNEFFGDNRIETIIHSASGEGYDGAQTRVLQVVVEDNDPAPTIALSLDPSSVEEGYRGTLRVTATLDRLVTVDTVMTLVLPFGFMGGLDEGDSRIRTIRSLTSTVLWDVEVILDRNNIIGDTKDLTFTVTTESGLLVSPALLEVVDGTLGKIVVSSSLTVSEDSGVSSYRVRLNAQPAGRVSVTVSIEDSAASNIYLFGGEQSHTLILPFNASNYAAGLEVFFAVKDNQVFEENRRELINHSVEGGDYFLPLKTLLVFVTDDEKAASVSMTMTVSEGEESDVDFPVDLKVKLLNSNGEVVMREGTTEVTLRLIGQAEVVEDYTITFSPENSVTPVSLGVVTAQIPSSGALSLRYQLSLIRDFIDEDTETFIIIGSVAGLPVVTASFRIIDHPDDVRGISIGEIPMVVEGGETNYTVVLNSRPTEEVTVELSTSSDEVTLSPSSLVIPTDLWRVAQGVNVRVRDNGISEGERNAEITYVVSGGDYDGFSLATSTVTIIEDDVESTKINLSLETSSVGEKFSSTPLLTAMLDSLPRDQTTTVHLSFLLNLDAREGDVLDVHFTHNFLDVISTIVIPAGETTAIVIVFLDMNDDDIDEEDERFTIVGSAEGLGDGSAIVTIIDDDERGIIVSPTGLELTEGEGAGKDYAVALTSEPTDDVMIALNIVDAEGVAVSIFFNGESLSFLTFAPEDWKIPYLLTVVADDNGHIQQRSTMVTIDHLASGGDYEGEQASLAVDVLDDETAAALITLNLLQMKGGELVPLEDVKESDGAVEVIVEAETTVPLYVDLPISLLVSAGNTASEPEDYTSTLFLGEPLTIPAGETSGRKTFSLTLRDDAIDEDNKTFGIGGAASGPASGLISEVREASLQILDDDTRNVIVTSPVTVAENGGRRTYSVRLGSQPDGSSDVEVEITDVARAAEDEGKGRTLEFFLGEDLEKPVGTSYDYDTFTRHLGTVLTFTTENWFEEQLVYVQLSDEVGVAQEDSVATITHSVTGGGYDGTAVPDVVLKLREVGFLVSGPTSADVLEGDSAEYSIRLASQPEQNVEMRVVLPQNLGIALSLSEESLTFTRDNFNESQTVSVTYEPDGLSTGDRVVEVTHVAVSGDINYDSDGASVAAVRLKFIDDEAFARAKAGAVSRQRGRGEWRARWEGEPGHEYD